MRITEPMTLATDYLMGGLAAALAARLLLAGSGQVSVRLWGWALGATAAASFLGGTFHGFAQMLPASSAQGLWKATLLSTGVGSACILAGGVLAATTGPARTVLLAAVLVKFAAFTVWAAGHDEFLGVIADYSLALVGLVAIQAAGPAGLGAPAARWILAGVGVSGVAALIQALRLAPHPRFNHNDLFHVVQMLALYLLYRGGMLLRDLR